MIAVPTSQPTMGEDTDILDKLLEAIEANGTMDRSERDRLMYLAFITVIKQVRSIEKHSIITVFSRQPVKTGALFVLGFILLHEFSTYVNIGVILAAVLKILGVPIG